MYVSFLSSVTKRSKVFEYAVKPFNVSFSVAILMEETSHPRESLKSSVPFIHFTAKKKLVAHRTDGTDYQRDLIYEEN